MKLLRNILLGLSVLLVLSSAGGYFYFNNKYKAPPNQLEIPPGDFHIPFTWKAELIGGRQEPYAALLLPVAIPGCPKTFYMQFDAGAPYSLFYEGKLQAIAKKAPAIRFNKIENGYYLKDFGFMVGGMPVQARKIKVIPHGSAVVDWADTAGVEVIGTIGADLIDRKVLVLNYPLRYIRLSDKVPAGVADKAAFTALEFDERRVVLAAVINQRETKVMFDSGASAFELLTDKETWQELAKEGGEVQASDVNSWGNTLTVHSVASDESISFGATVLPLQRVHYIQGTTFMQRTLMRLSGMRGMVGNKLFLEKTIVLDTQHRLFGVVE